MDFADAGPAARVLCAKRVEEEGQAGLSLTPRTPRTAPWGPQGCSPGVPGRRRRRQTTAAVNLDCTTTTNTNEKVDLEATAQWMKMLAVLEAEARTRRRENADLREHVLHLEEQLESERNTVAQLKREAAQAGDARLNRDAQAQLVELRAETCSLRQQLAARESAGMAVASAEERVARLERDVQRSQAENGELRQKLADALSVSTSSVAAEASELQLASVTTFVKQFLDESHELLASARNACLQLEAAAGRPASKGTESPPPVFDLQTCDVRSLLQIPDVLRYICAILHKAVAASGKWSRTFRYMAC